jgi:hypothetical protein
LAVSAACRAAALSICVRYSVMMILPRLKFPLPSILRYAR